MKDIIVKDGSLFVVPKSAEKAERAISEILTLSKQANTTDVKIDLRNLNMFDALKIATLTASYGLTQNLNNQYEVTVANEIVKSQIMLLSLTNLKVKVAQKITTRKSNNVLAVEV